HTDAVQAYGILPINVNELHIDLLSISGHKINGPKGIGFLYAREGVKLTPHLYGGEQERKRRAGTENTIAIAGLSKAIEILVETREEKMKQYKEMKAHFIQVLEEEQIEFKVNGDLEKTLPNIINISFPRTNVEQML